MAVLQQREAWLRFPGNGFQRGRGRLEVAIDLEDGVEQRPHTCSTGWNVVDVDGAGAWLIDAVDAMNLADIEGCSTLPFWWHRVRS